jgi:folate-binding protein YgfZ
MALKQDLVSLNTRNIIAITGEDKFSFLQKLITNNLQLLDNQQLIYAGLLNSQGRFLADFFIWLDYHHIFLDCHQNAVDSLLSKLNLYKLRAKVEIKKINNLQVFFSTQNQQNLGFSDPRQNNFGYRFYLEKSTTNVALPEFFYHHLRIQQKIPEGFYDLACEKAIIIEYGLQNFSMIDFTKGCYVGQEVIARAFHLGEIRKQIKSFFLENCNHNLQNFLQSKLSNQLQILITQPDLQNFNNENITFLSAIATNNSLFGLALIKKHTQNIYFLLDNQLNLI